MKKNEYNQIISILYDLHIAYPHYNIGRHLATAFDGYGDIWGITDKEMLFSLTKYKSELDMDFPHIDEKEIENIIKDGMDLANILKEEEDGGY